ncbi:MAG: Protein HemX [Candidatus Celerinatantimonas neptuna]|nr:MAG: Protein HemX [Candidatus Celerinatantimonas neptuna]
MTDEQSEKRPAKSSSHKVTLLIAIIALVATAGTAGYGWTLLQKMHQQLMQTKQQNNQLSQALNTAQVQAAKNDAKIHQQLTQTQDELTKQGQQSRTILSQLQNTTLSLKQRFAELDIHDLNQWRLYESQYLIHLAARKVWLEHDIQTAESLLKSADQSIANLHAPQYIPLRRAIADDLNHLDILPRVDIEGIIIQLNSLRDQISQLALTQAKLPDTAQKQKPQETGWKASLLRSWHHFIEQFITVRRRDGNVTPLLAPQKAWYLKQNLQLQLQQAALAAQRRQEKLYQQSLTQAHRWVLHYFMHNPAADHITDVLNQLAKKQVAPIQPPELGSVALIDKAVTKIGDTHSSKEDKR